MAIRDDFTAGEVLAAADLNDTFASKPPFAYGTATPTTTVEGFIWYDENSTPPEPKFWDGAAFQAVSAPGGLVHIATETFSAVSSVSLNGCFSATYDNYRILITETAASTSLARSIRFRAAGSDDTNSNYNYKSAVLTSSSNSVTWGNDTNGRTQTSAIVKSADSNVVSYVYDIVSPFLSRVTDCYGSSGVVGVANIQLSWWGFNAGTSFDGFSFIASTGNFTGNIRVYGYLNS